LAAPGHRKNYVILKKPQASRFFRARRFVDIHIRAFYSPVLYVACQIKHRRATRRICIASLMTRWRESSLPASTPAISKADRAI